MFYLKKKQFSNISDQSRILSRRETPFNVDIHVPIVSQLILEEMMGSDGQWKGSEGAVIG